MPGEKNHGELARRRVFKSGPVEEAIEGGGGGHERGNSPPLVRGVWGPPPRTFLSASMCVFNGDHILFVLVTKIFLVA